MNKKLIILALIGIFALSGTVSAYAATNSKPPQTSQPTATEPATEVEQDENVTLPAGGIDQATAEQAALASVPGSTLISCQLDDENGLVVYGVEIQKDGATYDVKVDAMTGKIIKTDQENDKESINNNDEASNDMDSDNVQHENDNEDPAGHEDSGQN